MLSIAAVLGGIAGGAAGAGTAFTLVGGVRNAYRSAKLWDSDSPEERREAGQSGVIAVLDLGIAGMLAYHLWQDHLRPRPAEISE
jgi:hypothetical protein